MTTRPLKFIAHVCRPSLYDKINNDEIVDEIKGLAYDFKRGLGFDQPVSNDEPCDETPPNGVSTTLNHSRRIPESIKFFQESVRSYINRNQDWRSDTELSYIYKTYFNTPHARFNLISFAGDIIITKAALENVNDEFAKVWFDGVLEIILECLSIE
jgi:hypothetical protein